MKGIAYRPEIDGLRAIAVLSIVAYHAGFGPAAGFVGVDIFFVISGYLITRLLLHEHRETGNISLIGFYERRVRRIFPALAIVIVATVVASCILLGTIGDQQHALQSATASLLFVANFFFQLTSGDYFDSRTELMPLLHLWSLAVEEQFYIFWPLLMLILLRLRRRVLLPASFGLVIVSLVLAEGMPQATAFYQMPARLWELAAGGVIAMLPVRKLPSWSALAGAATILVACLIPMPRFPGIGALPAVAGTGLLIAAVHGGGNLGHTGRWLRAPPMRFFGLISYSLYLWHWPLLAFDRATRIGEAPLGTRLLLCAIAVLISWVSYRFIESPTRRRDGTPPLKVVVTGVATFGMLAVCVTVAIAPKPRASEIHDLPLARRCHYSAIDEVGDFPRRGCAGEVVVWGDSYALSWRPLAEAIAAQRALPITSHTRDSCGPIQNYAIRRPPVDRLCPTFNTKVAEYLNSVDTIILAGDWQSYLHDEQARQGLRESLVAVNPRNLILIGPTPTLRDDAPRCVHLKADCSIPRTEFDLATAQVRSFLKSLAIEHGAEYIEAADFLCTASECPAAKDGITLYRDTQHVSAQAAGKFSEIYVANNRQVLPQ